MTPAIFRRAASADVEEAYGWYEAQQSGLGIEFLRAIDVAVAFVEENPFACAVVHRDTRRALLRRFPYGLFYRVINEQVVVVACAHVKRHPRSWRARR